MKSYAVQHASLVVMLSQNEYVPAAVDGMLTVWYSLPLALLPAPRIE